MEKCCGTTTIKFMGALFFLIGINSPSAFSSLVIPQKTLSRWNHAQELLGERYWNSVVRSGEQISDIDRFLFQWIRRALVNARFSQLAIPRMTRQIGEAIIFESEKYGFDPVFLLAVIQNESSFNPMATGKAGEVGLMQLKFVTAEWIAKKFSLSYEGPQSLRNPVINIRIGSAYLAYLRKEFSFQSHLYLEAYNKGSSHVKKALVRKGITKQYVSRVLTAYVNFYSKLLA